MIGSGITWKGNLSGSGGVRVEGALEGDVALRGLLVVSRDRQGNRADAARQHRDRGGRGARRHYR